MKTEDLRESIRYRLPVGLPDETLSQRRGDRVSATTAVGDGVEELDQRREGDALPIRRGLRDQHAGAPVDRIGERLTQPRLADAGWREDRDEDARRVLARVLQGVVEH